MNWYWIQIVFFLFMVWYPFVHGEELRQKSAEELYSEAFDALEIGQEGRGYLLMRLAAEKKHEMAALFYGQHLYLQNMRVRNIRGMQEGLQWMQKGLRILKEKSYCNGYYVEYYGEKYQDLKDRYDEKADFLRHIIDHERFMESLHYGW